MLFDHPAGSLIHESNRYLSCVRSVFLEESCLLLNSLYLDTSIEKTKPTLIDFAIISCFISHRTKRKEGLEFSTACLFEISMILVWIRRCLIEL